MFDKFSKALCVLNDHAAGSYQSGLFKNQKTYWEAIQLPDHGCVAVFLSKAAKGLLDTKSMEEELDLISRPDTAMPASEGAAALIEHACVGINAGVQQIKFPHFVAIGRKVDDWYGVVLLEQGEHKDDHDAIFADLEGLVNLTKGTLLQQQ